MSRGVRFAMIAAMAVVLVSCATTTVPTTPSRGPSSAPTTPSAAGLFRGEQPWTLDVSSAAASERSPAILAALGAAGGWGNGNVLQADFSMPLVTTVDAPRTTVSGAPDYCFGGAPDCDPLPTEIPLPDGAVMEGSQDLTCDTSSEDCHLLVVDPAARRLHEIYQGTRSGDGLTAGAYVSWDLDRTYTDQLRGAQCTSADAAGLPIAALTPTADEVASGRIGHALRFVLPNDRIRAGVYVPPASHAGGPENSGSDAPPYGTHLRLRADADLARFTEPQRVVLTALQTYGMYLSDGGEIALTFADDRFATAKWAELGIDSRTFGDIPVDAFEVIDHGPEVPVTNECARIDR